MVGLWQPGFTTLAATTETPGCNGSSALAVVTWRAEVGIGWKATVIKNPDL